MIEVMLVEDDVIIRGLLKKMVERVEGFRVIAEVSSPDEAVAAFEKSPAGVVFVDIDLNGESGLYCARRLCDMAPEVRIVFATAHSEYMADAFEIYAFDYIVKPFNMERIARTLGKIKDMEQKSGTAHGDGGGRDEAHDSVGNVQNSRLAVKGREEIVFVDIDSIIFAERVNGATRIVTEKEIYRMNISLTELMDKLPKDRFMRSHRSYIINISDIARLTQYGRWTYTIGFKGTAETALMTYENYEIIKGRFF